MAAKPYELGETLLSIEGVNLSFGERLILQDVSASVRNITRTECDQGQVYGLLGPSGIGKTQLLRIMAGFQQPDTGRVLIHNPELAPRTPENLDPEDPHGLMRLRPTCEGLVGVVTQNYRVIDHMTALQNLVFAGTQGGLSRQDATAKAEKFLERFGLLPQKDLWPQQLSGGQRQRLAILQQIMMGHQLIFMDEPFSGLDLLVLEEVVKLIREITSVNEYLTIIVVTHDIGAAISVADHLWIMGRRDHDNNLTQGARIVEEYNLIDLGLAWQENIRALPEFAQLTSLVNERFHNLR